MKIQKNKVVSIHYTLKNKEGETIDTTREGDVLAYIHGIGSLVRGLENELDGKEVGFVGDITVLPEVAFGNYDEKNVQIVPLEGFKAKGEEQLQVGMQVQVDSNEGPKIALVTAIENDDVTLDLNHPFARETLYFHVEVVAVRDATNEELKHGHAHGVGGHHH